MVTALAWASALTLAGEVKQLTLVVEAFDSIASDRGRTLLPLLRRGNSVGGVNSGQSNPPQQPSRYRWLWLLGIGAVAGFLSGIFGVGGGVVIVPLLVLLLGFDQKLAAGTSLAAIVPTSLVGVISYSVTCNVSWISGALLAVGAVGGAQLGTLLLHRLPQRVIRWAFIAFMMVVVVSLFVVVPSRGDTVDYTPLSIAGLIAVGVVVGILAGILGIGGGVVVVPVLILVFGASDLVAKGTSLLMMVPTAISGTFGNTRRSNVNLRAAALIGLAACVTVTLGAFVAGTISPLTGNILFAAFLTVVLAQLVVKAVSSKR
jgi:uncharacterized membrane protein YfcA